MYASSCFGARCVGLSRLLLVIYLQSTLCDVRASSPWFCAHLMLVLTDRPLIFSVFVSLCVCIIMMIWCILFAYTRPALLCLRFRFVCLCCVVTSCFASEQAVPLLAYKAAVRALDGPGCLEALEMAREARSKLGDSAEVDTMGKEPCCIIPLRGHRGNFYCLAGCWSMCTGEPCRGQVTRNCCEENPRLDV